MEEKTKSKDVQGLGQHHTVSLWKDQDLTPEMNLHLT